MGTIYIPVEVIREIISVWTVLGVIIILTTRTIHIKSYWRQVAWLISIGPLGWVAWTLGSITPGYKVKFAWTPLIMLVLFIVVLVAIQGN
jgi:hypothetical protein